METTATNTAPRRRRLPPPPPPKPFIYHPEQDRRRADLSELLRRAYTEEYGNGNPLGYVLLGFLVTGITLVLFAAWWFGGL